MTKFSVDELVMCARRELVQRRRVYPRLIEKGKMSQLNADREIAMMAEIKEILESMQKPKLF